MEIQPINFGGRIVAACTPTRVFFSDELEARTPEAPLKRFVCVICLYAGDVLNGQVPGRYRDADARGHARALLIPRELFERPGPAGTLDLKRAARGLGVPLEELFVEFGRALASRRRASVVGSARCRGCAR